LLQHIRDRGDKTEGWLREYKDQIKSYDFDALVGESVVHGFKGAHLFVLLLPDRPSFVTAIRAALTKSNLFHVYAAGLGRMSKESLIALCTDLGFDYCRCVKGVADKGRDKTPSQHVYVYTTPAISTVPKAVDTTVRAIDTDVAVGSA